MAEAAADLEPLDGTQSGHVKADPLAFLAGPGEMAVLMRSQDWSATPLGDPRGWPQPLRTVVRLMLNTQHPMFVFWGPALTCLYNDGYRASIGPERHSSALGSPGLDVWAEIWDIIGPQIDLVMSGGGATWNENHLVPITRHGRREDVYWTYSYSPIDDEISATGVGGVLVVCTETTAQVLAEQRQAEQAAARAAERDPVWNNSRDLLVVGRADGTFRAINPACRDILGYEPQEMVGRSFLDFVWPDDATRTQTGLAAAVAGHDLTNFENRYRHKEGNVRWLSWHTSVEGDLVYAYGRDITEQKQAEAELAIAHDALRQAQKMEAVGQLTGGIAHDFNNMLQGVTSGITLAGRRITSGRLDDAKRCLDAAREAAARAGLLTQRLLAFGRRQALDPKPVVLDDLVRGMAELIQQTVGPAIKVELRMHDGCGPVRCDPNQLENALLNLAINARDAMLPQGGRLLIETRPVVLADADIAGWDGAGAGEYVRVTVRDTGVGMPPDVLAHAFEPFFTTKPNGRGTGLGLSQLDGFVRQSNGTVRLESEVGAGTSVHIDLPRSYAAPVSPVAAATDESGTKALIAAPITTVLLVEDEAAVRGLVAETLREIGYLVIEAEDGPGGLKALQGAFNSPEAARPHMLVTDIGLPGGLNGRQLADAARGLDARLPILLITGFAGDAINGEGRLEPGMEMLGKPFELDVLTARVQAMIERSRHT